MRLLRIPKAFDHPDWLSEVKFDGVPHRHNRRMTYCLRSLILVALLPIALPSLTALQRSEVVVVDGRRVEVIRRGAGTPTLVLESGGGVCTVGCVAARVANHRLDPRILPSVPPAARADYELILKIHHAGRVDGLLPLPDLPLAVITALKPCPPGDDWTCRDPQALTVWRELHDEWFATSSRALRIVSARSGHDVVGDQPALIVDAVRFVINEVRSQTDNVRGSSKKK